MVRRVRTWLADPRLAGVDVDSDHLVQVHRAILADKPMMLGVFREFYDTCVAMDRRHFAGEGLRVEIGAGVSLFKKYHPEILSTDIKAAPHLDRVVDALAMPFDAGTVRAIYGINCFHHFPSPDRFFGELQRVLTPGGGCVLIEPAYGPLARFMYRRMFDTEVFEPGQKGWDAAGGMGVMQGANQALSYIVFVRDRAEFERRHPGLEIVERRTLRNYPRYLLSGGLNFRSLVPGAAVPLLRAAEAAAAPLAGVLGLHQVIVLRKRGG